MDQLTERLRKFVRTRVSSRQDAEDVIQDAYLRVLRYSADNVVEDWERLLFSAARNLAVDCLRRHRTREKGVAECAVLAREAGPASDVVIDARQRLKHVEAAIAALPERCRNIFLMHRVDGLSYGQIARVCGISVSAVEKHIARACLLIEAQVNTEADCR